MNIEMDRVYKSTYSEVHLSFIELNNAALLNKRRLHRGAGGQCNVQSFTEYHCLSSLSTQVCFSDVPVSSSCLLAS